MARFVVEGGVYALLLFTPFAFGGVELWAEGVFQIVTGLVVVAWVVSRREDRPLAARGTTRFALPALWIPLGSFVLLVILQLVPLPPRWIARLSPGVHDLYSRAVPGYVEGRDFHSAELIPWLLRETADRIPPVRDQGENAVGLNPPLSDVEFPTRASSWRTLTIYPFATRRRLTLFLCYIGLFAVVASHFRTRDRLTRLLAVAGISGFAVSLFGIIQKLTWNGSLYWVREGDYPGAFGPFVNRNSYAAFAGTLFPLALCLTLRALAEMRRRRQDALPSLLLWGLAAVVISGGVFFSLSRGGIVSTGLSMFIVLALLIYSGRRVVEVAFLGALVLASAALLVWIGSGETVERIATLSEGMRVDTFARRLGAWKSSLGLLADHPLFGTGLGTFGFAFKHYAPPTEGWWRRAHNEYIEVTCDTGLAGAVILLALLGTYVFYVGRPARFRGRIDRYAYAGLVSGLLGLLFHSAVSSNLQLPANAMLMAILGAALLGLVIDEEPGGGHGWRVASGPSGPRLPRTAGASGLS